MKVCLGFQCLNEASWLALHLPVMLRANWDGVVAVDGGSTDGSPDVIREICQQADIPLHLSTSMWQWDFARQQNTVIQLTEMHGYQAMLKWDPDELLFPDHINQAFDLLRTGKHKALKLPRLNFEGDRLHYCPYMYPDMQLRFHVLGEGFHWRGRLHASVNAWDMWHEHPNNDVQADRTILYCPHIPIYHYEGIKPIAERSLKWMNYTRIKNDQVPLESLPAAYRVPTMPVRFTVAFVGEQPLLVLDSRYDGLGLTSGHLFCTPTAPYESEE